MRSPYPLLNIDELRALMHAGLEIQARDMSWSEARGNALDSALAKLAAEVARREAFEAGKKARR